MSKLKAALKDIEAVCRGHGVRLTGRLESDGFTADIVLFKPPEEPNILEAKGEYILLRGINHEAE